MVYPVNQPAGRQFKRANVAIMGEIVIPVLYMAGQVPIIRNRLSTGLWDRHHRRLYRFINRSCMRMGVRRVVVCLFYAG